MTDDLKKIIENSNFEIQDGNYIYAKVSSDYIIVKEDKIDEARNVLLNLGFKEAK